MISAPTFTINGVEAEKTKLPEKVFGVKADEKLLAQSVRVYLSNQRKSNAKTKTRSEIAKTTAKMYKQKGTGRARHGSYSAPVFVGGGIAHGPTGTQNYKLVMPKMMELRALLGALHTKAEQKLIVVINDTGKTTGKTKEAKNIMDKAGVNAASVLFLVAAKQKPLAKSWRNLKKVSVATCDNLCPFIILSNKYLVLTAEAIRALEKKYEA